MMLLTIIELPAIKTHQIWQLFVWNHQKITILNLKNYNFLNNPLIDKSSSNNFQCIP
jgi:hypothetical protein